MDKKGLQSKFRPEVVAVLCESKHNISIWWSDFKSMSDHVEWYLNYASFEGVLNLCNFSQIDISILLGEIS